ncbi:hypothetical protein ACH4YO_42615 [Streptomyces noursei]|uniref:hypothetical protein n=1 Tax=Streptomyces noursei TaxID=1971 RepID=UPI0033D4711B
MHLIEYVPAEADKSTKSATLAIDAFEFLTGGIKDKLKALKGGFAHGAKFFKNGSVKEGIGALKDLWGAYGDAISANSLRLSADEIAKIKEAITKLESDFPVIPAKCLAYVGNTPGLGETLWTVATTIPDFFSPWGIAKLVTARPEAIHVNFGQKTATGGRIAKPTGMNAASNFWIDDSGVCKMQFTVKRKGANGAQKSVAGVQKGSACTNWN